jgi:hypothetical protein
MMSWNLEVNGNNRDEIQSRYVNYLISRMDFIEIRNVLKDYINTDKIFYSHDDLLDEIKARGPEAISEVFNRSSNLTVNEEVLL